VRRDGCPAVVKIQERAMRTLFETSDLSAVRAYLQRQWTKILAGRVSLQDFVFAKEASGCAPCCCCCWRSDFCI
jgi:DNA polymerase zeta